MSGNVFSAEVGWEAKFQSPSDLDKDAACLHTARFSCCFLDVCNKLRQLSARTKMQPSADGVGHGWTKWLDMA